MHKDARREFEHESKRMVSAWQKALRKKLEGGARDEREDRALVKFSLNKQDHYPVKAWKLHLAMEPKSETKQRYKHC